jgi:hypothetical protein
MVDTISNQRAHVNSSTQDSLPMVDEDDVDDDSSLPIFCVTPPLRPLIFSLQDILFDHVKVSMSLLRRIECNMLFLLTMTPTCFMISLMNHKWLYNISNISSGGNKCKSNINNRWTNDRISQSNNNWALHVYNFHLHIVRCRMAYMAPFLKTSFGKTVREGNLSASVTMKVVYFFAIPRAHHSMILIHDTLAACLLSTANRHMILCIGTSSTEPPIIATTHDLLHD